MSEFLLTREVAELLRTPESTVRYWRHTRTGPPSLKVGRRVLYRRDAVLAWLGEQEQRVSPPRPRPALDDRQIAERVRGHSRRPPLRGGE